MGLGKTIQAIAISYYYKNEWPLLIVVPSSLRYPWVDEMEKWIPELSPDDISIIQNKTDIGWVQFVILLQQGLLTTPCSSRATLWAIRSILCGISHSSQFSIFVL